MGVAVTRQSVRFLIATAAAMALVWGFANAGQSQNSPPPQPMPVTMVPPPPALTAGTQTSKSPVIERDVCTKHPNLKQCAS